MSSYKLYYFNFKARGETARMLFHLSGTPFEDIRVALGSEDWLKLKPKMPLEQIPVVEVDGKMIAQSGAIIRFLARKFGLYGRDEFEHAKTDMIVDTAVDFILPLYDSFDEPSEEKKMQMITTFKTEKMPKLLANLEKNLDSSGYCVGKSLSLGDIALYNALDTAADFKVEVNLENYPRLKALQTNVCCNPKIATWLKERPHTDY